jgi:hypothetical protein
MENWSLMSRQIKYLFLILLFNLIFYFPVFQCKVPLPADNLLVNYPWRIYTEGYKGENPAYFDVMMITYPWKKLGVSEMKQGRFPLWNQFFGLGYPYFAAMQGGFLYPTTLLFLALPFATAWPIHIFLQTFLAGIFMFWFLRKLNLSHLTSLYGSLIFSFCGHFMVWLEYGTLVNAACWLPLSILLINLFFEKPKFGFLLALSLVWSISFFAGFPQTSFYLIIFSGIYFLAQLIGRKAAFFGRHTLGYLFSLCLFLGLVAIQLLPFLEYLSQTTRIFKDPKEYFSWAILPTSLIDFIFPNFFGHPAKNLFWGRGNYQESTLYFGVIPFILAVWAAVKLRRKIRFWLICLGGVLLLAIYNPILLLFYKLNLPFISKMAPSRLAVLLAFILSVISSYAFEDLIKNKWPKLKTIFLIYSGVFLDLILTISLFRQNFLQIRFGYDFLRVSSIIKESLLIPFISLTLFMFIILLKAKFKLKKDQALFLIIFFTTLDLFHFGWSYNPFIRTKDGLPKTGTVEFLQKDQEVYRYLSQEEVLPGNLGSLFGLSGITAYETLTPIAYQKFIQSLNESKYSFDQKPILNDYQNLNQRFLDWAGVKYILSTKEVQLPHHQLVYKEGADLKIYQRKNYLPRFFLLLDHQKYLPVEIVENQADKIILKVHSSPEAKLVVGNLYLPGWEVKINGRNQKVTPFMDFFLSSEVAPGSKQVEITYRPKAFRIGIIISLMTLCLLIVYSCCYLGLKLVRTRTK